VRIGLCMTFSELRKTLSVMRRSRVCEPQENAVQRGFLRGPRGRPALEMERISALLKAYSSLIEPVRDLQPEQKSRRHDSR